MELFNIILLVFFGLLFLVAELVLLPGVSVGALLALVSDGSAILPRGLLSTPTSETSFGTETPRRNNAFAAPTPR